MSEKFAEIFFLICFTRTICNFCKLIGKVQGMPFLVRSREKDLRFCTFVRFLDPPIRYAEHDNAASELFQVHCFC